MRGSRGRGQRVLTLFPGKTTKLKNFLPILVWIPWESQSYRASIQCSASENGVSLWGDDNPLLVAIRSSPPPSSTKKSKKNVVKVVIGPSLVDQRILDMQTNYIHNALHLKVCGHKSQLVYIYFEKCDRHHLSVFDILLFLNNLKRQLLTIVFRSFSRLIVSYEIHDINM